MSTPSPRHQIFAWSVYDLANTIYSAIFVTFFFPLYAKGHLGATEDQIGLVSLVATLAAAVAVPIIGALSDAYGRRMPFIIFFTIATCVSCAAVAVMPLWGALLCAILANFFYSICLAVYDALLPKIAPEGKEGSVSGIGVGVGYLGTPVGLAFAVPVMLYFGQDNPLTSQIIFVLVGALFFAFACYTFAIVREPKTPSERTAVQEVQVAFSALAQTLRTIPSIRGFLPFLIGLFIVANSIFAVIVFLFLFGQERLGITPVEFAGVYTLMAIVAGSTALGMGFVTDRFGPKRVLLGAVVLWLIALALFLRADSRTIFYLCGCIGGAALGTHWTAARPWLMTFAESGKMGEYFGFLALVNKVSGAFGPWVFGVVVVWFNYTAGIMLLMALFALGGGILLFVPDKTSRGAMPAQPERDAPTA